MITPASVAATVPMAKVMITPVKRITRAIVLLSLKPCEASVQRSRGRSGRLPHVHVTTLLLLQAILAGALNQPARASTPAMAATADSPASVPTPADVLTVRAQSRQAVWNGVAVAPDGRVFVVMPRLANSTGPQLAQLGADGSLTPYPDATWNGAPAAAAPAASQPSHPPAAPQPAAPAFVGLNAIHLAPDGALWAVDTGSPAFGKPALTDVTRLIRIDLGTNQVTCVLTLPADVLRPKSMIDDVRFNGSHAYVTDAGAPGLIVVDLAAGSFRRVLDRDPALTAERPTVVDGEVLKGLDGKPVMIHADQLEVTPDGHYLYVQPLSGPMSRIATALLDDPQASPRALSSGLAFWYQRRHSAAPRSLRTARSISRISRPTASSACRQRAR